MGGCEIFHGLHADDTLQCRQLNGLVGLFLLCLDGSHPLLFEDF